MTFAFMLWLPSVSAANACKHLVVFTAAFIIWQQMGPVVECDSMAQCGQAAMSYRTSRGKVTKLIFTPLYKFKTTGRRRPTARHRAVLE